MALFTRTFHRPEPTLAPLFRLLDDFDSYAREASGGVAHGRHSRHQQATFNPKFDMKETESQFELHGELPGVEKKDITMEFVDNQTLLVSGRVERSYTAGTPPAGLVGGTTASGAITEGSETATDSAAQKTGDAAAHETTENKSDSTETTAAAETAAAKPDTKETSGSKYWVSERSVGEFSRTFHFPGNISQEGVKAGLDNGILTVIVPKAKKPESRRINID